MELDQFIALKPKELVIDVVGGLEQGVGDRCLGNGEEWPAR